MNLNKYIKHLSKRDKKSLSQKALKVAEEAGELAKVILPYDLAHCTQHRFSDNESILEEIVDTYLASISIAYSLDFTDEDINNMIFKKCKKWAELQDKEEVDFPLPYEIHVSISGSSDSEFIDKFKKDCKSISVKPIIIDLECNDSIIIKDVMTSSKFIGYNRTAYEESIRIVNSLKDMGYDVLRNKIETVPWHPAAPTKNENMPIPNGCYFESHIGVIIMPSEKESLQEFINSLNDKSRVKLSGSCKLSQNFFKKSNDESKFVNMLTYRDNKTSRSNFENDVNNIKLLLNNNGFNFEKVEVEYAIYDTNVNHDSKWINEK